MPPLVTEMWSPPKYDKNTSAYRAQRVFNVTGAASMDIAISLVNAEDPTTVYNAKHPLSPWMYVDGQSVDMAGFAYPRVTISYSSSPAGRHFDPGNALNEPIKYMPDWELETEGCVRDSFGNAIQNSAGQSFSTDPPTNVLNGTILINRYEAYYNMQMAVAYANAVCSAPFTFGPGGIWTVDKGQAQLKIVKCLSEITTASPYALVQYQIKVKQGFVKDSDGYWDAFKLRILNEGTIGWHVPASGQKAAQAAIVESINNQWQNVSYPIRLKADGTPMQATYMIAHAGNVMPDPPVANPNTQPTTTIYEATADAVFVKVFPETVKLLDLNMLGL